jgi:hypothetical protein
MTIVCDSVGGLEPHGFTATTLTVYEPGPAGPLSARRVVGKLATIVPVTLST